MKRFVPILLALCLLLASCGHTEPTEPLPDKSDDRPFGVSDPLDPPAVGVPELPDPEPPEDEPTTQPDDRFVQVVPTVPEVTETQFTFSNLQVSDETSSTYYEHFGYDKSSSFYKLLRSIGKYETSDAMSSNFAEYANELWSMLKDETDYFIGMRMTQQDDGWDVRFETTDSSDYCYVNADIDAYQSFGVQLHTEDLREDVGTMCELLRILAGFNVSEDDLLAMVDFCEANAIGGKYFLHFEDRENWDGLSVHCFHGVWAVTATHLVSDWDEILEVN